MMSHDGVRFRFRCVYLFVQRQGVDLGQNPANAAVSSTHQDPERIELLEQPQPDTETHSLFPHELVHMKHI